MFCNGNGVHTARASEGQIAMQGTSESSIVFAPPAPSVGRWLPCLCQAAGERATTSSWWVILVTSYAARMTEVGLVIGSVIVCHDVACAFFVQEAAKPGGIEALWAMIGASLGLRNITR